jgi:prepilin-type N-terminal cleavage/methylation domain-containing protein
MSRPSKIRRAFTLVELLVAVALMTILTGSVVFIFLQAQRIFIRVDAKVQVYQYARYAFDQMERDLANVVCSRNMEFFNDEGAPTGIPFLYDNPNEQIPIRGTANLDGDPMNGNDIYNYGFTLRQPTPYVDLKGDPRRRDSIYFKTVTSVGGQTCSALVEYALVDTDKVRPRLLKRLWRVTGVDNSGLAPRYEVNGGQAMPLEQNLCLYAVECRFEIFVINRRRSDAGDFYECSELVEPPRVPDNSREVFPSHRNYWRGRHRMVQGYYDHTHARGQVGSRDDSGLFKKGEEGLFKTEQDFVFPMLREGDRIFLYLRTGNLPKRQDYTIKAFLQAGTREPWDPNMDKRDFRIEFEEKLEFKKSSASTLVPAEDVKVLYATPWVPPAVRVTLRVKDAKSLQLRSVSRTFKIMGN